MAQKVREFRGLIYSKFDSESELARHLNWPRQKLNKITNGVRQPDLQEIDALSKPLGVTPNQLMQIFLRYSSPDRQQNSNKDKVRAS